MSGVVGGGIATFFCIALVKSYYFITFLDAYTKWLEVDTFSHNNHAFRAFKDCIQREERISEKESKSLRTDNGTEYYSSLTRY